MSNKIINYYVIFMIILFVIFNLILVNLKVCGMLYKVLIFLLIIINSVILILFRKRIKYKTLIILLYVLLLFFSKDLMQCMFALSNIIILCVIGFLESHVIKIISILITLFISIYLPLYFIILIIFGSSLDNKNNIYEDTHYYCNNHYEIYIYSSGAMDSSHYIIGVHYELLNIDDIINITYRKGNEVSLKEYSDYLNKNNCKLVGENNGFK